MDAHLSAITTSLTVTKTMRRHPNHHSHHGSGHHHGSDSLQNDRPSHDNPSNDVIPRALSNSDASSASSAGGSVSSASIASGLNLPGTDSANAPPSSSQLPPSPEPAKPIGLVVGLAVAILIIGLLIGAMLMWCVFKYRQKQRINSIQFMRPQHSPAKSEKIPVIQGEEAPKARGERFALDAIPDKDIEMNFGKLCDLIQRHVRNNYHCQPVEAESKKLLEVLENIGFGNLEGQDLDAIVSMALDPSKRIVALQHVVSKFLFSSIDVDSRGKFSLLPEPLVTFLRSVPLTDRLLGNDEAIRTALSQWRVLSAFLLHPGRARRTSLVPTESAVLNKSRELMVPLNAFLEVFVHPAQASRIQQTSDLQDVMFECSNFGYQLVSQPCEWRFTYKSPSTDSDEDRIVLCPGLVKMTGPNGEVYSTTNIMVQPILSDMVTKMEPALNIGRQS